MWDGAPKAYRAFFDHTEYGAEPVAGEDPAALLFSEETKWHYGIN